MVARDDFQLAAKRAETAHSTAEWLAIGQRGRSAAIYQELREIDHHAANRCGSVRVAMKVMLVEDDELVRATLVDGLEDAGIQVAEFSDPEKALSPPETVDPPDVVITDIDLGSKLNGFDVAAAVHHRWPSVRVLLISGLPADHTGHRLDPRDRYLQKPLSNRRLLRTIDELAKAA